MTCLWLRLSLLLLYTFLSSLSVRLNVLIVCKQAGKICCCEFAVMKFPLIFNHASNHFCSTASCQLTLLECDSQRFQYSFASFVIKVFCWDFYGIIDVLLSYLLKSISLNSSDLQAGNASPIKPWSQITHSLPANPFASKRELHDSSNIIRR